MRTCPACVLIDEAHSFRIFRRQTLRGPATIPAEDEELEISGRSIVDQCGGIIIIRHKTADAPRRVDAAEKVRGIARLQIHIEAIERNLETLATCFDVGLFASPTQEEPLNPPLSRESGQ